MNEHHSGMWQEYVRPPIILSVIFAFIFSIAYVITQRRDQQCSEKCAKVGARGYEYQAISGYYRHLEPDSCKCIS